MRVLITGSSGLIGSAVSRALRAAGHEVAPLRRGSGEGARWQPESGKIDLGPAGRIDAAIHLGGESLATGRWTAAKKERILRSRIDGTRVLAEAVARMEPRPAVLLSASAVGIYGSRGDGLLDEASACGSGFLAGVCRRWEESAQPAADAGIRLVNLRLGVVLSAQGGALAAMLPPFRLGVAGPLGSGRQWMSWVSLEDAVAAMLFLLAEPSVSGPVNIVSPNPVTNRQFTATLARVLQRPAFIPVPALALRLLLGPMADEAMLASQRAVPKRLLSAGFQFGDADLEKALRRTLGR